MTEKRWYTNGLAYALLTPPPRLPTDTVPQPHGISGINPNSGPKPDWFYNPSGLPIDPRCHPPAAPLPLHFTMPAPPPPPTLEMYQEVARTSRTPVFRVPEQSPPTPPPRFMSPIASRPFPRPATPYAHPASLYTATGSHSTGESSGYGSISSRSTTPAGSVRSFRTQESRVGWGDNDVNPAQAQRQHDERANIQQEQASEWARITRRSGCSRHSSSHGGSRHSGSSRQGHSSNGDSVRNGGSSREYGSHSGSHSGSHGGSHGGSVRSGGGSSHDQSTHGSGCSSRMGGR